MVRDLANRVTGMKMGQATLRYMIANLSITSLYAGEGERLQGGQSDFGFRMADGGCGAEWTDDMDVSGS
jgi:hypothetical protein